MDLGGGEAPWENHSHTLQVSYLVWEEIPMKTTS